MSSHVLAKMDKMRCSGWTIILKRQVLMPPIWLSTFSEPVQLSVESMIISIYVRLAANSQVDSNYGYNNEAIIWASKQCHREMAR